MKIFRSLALLAALAVGAFSLAACGTGLGAADPAASGVSASAVASHFKADLATGYDTIKVVRIGATNALQAHAITADQAEAIQTQCKAFTATLDSLRAAGESPGNQTTLTATLVAIQAATVFITVSQGVPKS